MKRKRVVFVVPTADAYGGENALLDLLLKFSSDVEPVVLAPSDGPLVRALTDAGIETRIQQFPILERRYFHPLRIFAYLGSGLLSIFRLYALLRDIRPDLVHTNNALILPAAVAARAARVPHVWHVREILEAHHIHPRLWTIWRWLIVSFSARVICISTAVRKQFRDGKKVSVIHDGVDPDLFHPLRKKPSRLTRGKKGVTIGVVGRLEHRRKGQDLFIEAASIASQPRDDLRFVIAGHEREGMEEKERVLHEMVQEYGLREKVEFRGFVPRERMPDLMNELDALVLCSKQPEGLGIVLLEAMACEKAVIAFSEGGPLDIIEDHENGLLIPPGDVPALARAMVELADNPKLRRDLGLKGRKTVEGFFRSELTAKKVSELYDEILSHTS